MLTRLRRHLFQAPALTDFLAGAILGFMLLTESVSSAALIFSGSLAPSFHLGVGGIIVGSALIIALTAWRSQFTFAIARPDSNTYPLLALMAVSIAERLRDTNNLTAVLPTLWLTLTLGLVCTGLIMYLLGRLRLSQTLRYLPYTVVGGFLAGSGWLLMRGSFTVMTGVPLELARLTDLASSASLMHWGPGVCLALVLLITLRRYRHPLILPLLLLVAMALTHLGLWMAGITLPQAIAQGWLLEPLTDVQLQPVWSLSLGAVNWQVVLSQTWSQMTVIAIAVIAIGLNAASLEVATGQDVDLDQELQTAGLGNVLSGLAGGMVIGALSASRSQLNQRASVNGRLSGLLAALVCIALPFLAAPALSLLPRPVLGGLLLYLGLNHVVEWVYDGWFRLPRVEYGLVLLILLVIAASDFVRGVGIGVVIACILFVVNYSRTQHVRYTLSGDYVRSNYERGTADRLLLKEHGRQIVILALQGYLFFGMAYALLQQVRARFEDPTYPRLRYIILDFRLVTGLDASAILNFVKLRQLTRRYQASLIFADLTAHIESRLRKGGCLDDPTGLTRVFPTFNEALEWCEDQVLQSHAHETLANPASRTIDLFVERAEDLSPYLERREFEPGDMIVRQGDPPGGMFYLRQGLISIVFEAPDGRQQRLRRLGPGTITGEMSLFTNAPRSATIVATEPSVVEYLSPEAVARLQHERPDLTDALNRSIIRLLADRLFESNQHLANLQR